jgi:hypothetical protein
MSTQDNRNKKHQCKKVIKCVGPTGPRGVSPITCFIAAGVTGEFVPLPICESPVRVTYLVDDTSCELFDSQLNFVPGFCSQGLRISGSAVVIPEACSGCYLLQFSSVVRVVSFSELIELPSAINFYLCQEVEPDVFAPIPAACTQIALTTSQQFNITIQTIACLLPGTLRLCLSTPANGTIDVLPITLDYTCSSFSAVRLGSQQCPPLLP